MPEGCRSGLDEYVGPPVLPCGPPRYESFLGAIKMRSSSGKQIYTDTTIRKGVTGPLECSRFKIIST